VKLATLCYLKRDGHTLMLHRRREGDYHRGKYNGLGGKLLSGESPEDCVRREVYEESGLSVTEMRFRGVLTFPLFDGRDDWYVFVYTVTGFEGKLRASAEGELSWVADEDLLGLELWPGDRIFLPWLEGSETFSATFRYQGGRLRDYEASFY
jgi:8-oxo-dGTP diphosphatase